MTSIRCARTHHGAIAPLLIAAVMLLTPMQSAATEAPYTCVFGGKTYHQDEPCGRAKHTSSYNYDAQGRRIAAPPESETIKQRPIVAAPPAQPFSGTPSSQLAQAGAVVESTRIDARECEWRLKVHKDFKKCANFAKELKTGSRYMRALDTLATLSEDPAFAQATLVKLNELIPQL